MKKLRTYLLLIAIVSFISGSVIAQVQNSDVYEFPGYKQKKLLNYRYNINIPDIEGYLTLKCDFHMHTVFSDGLVWPSMRVIEAWTDGLDAIAISDHIELKGRKNKDILQIDLNKSDDIAVETGRRMDMLVIRGAEITRSKPLGHINALFVKDVKELDVPNELDAIDAAVKQGAFLQWNHPGFPNDTSTMYPVHQKLISQKKLNAVEVFNGSELYPKVLDWCDENKMAYMANSDMHSTSANSYREKLERPMTLVFAKERSVEGIREALFAGRTLAYFYNHLAGKEELLKEVVQKSISTKVINVEKGTIDLINHSDITFEIKFGNYEYSIPVYANQTIRLDIPSGTEIQFTNCMIRKDKMLVMKLW